MTVAKFPAKRAIDQNPVIAKIEDSCACILDLASMRETGQTKVSRVT